MDIVKLIEESIEGNFKSFRFLRSQFLTSRLNKNIFDELKKARNVEDEITLYLYKKTLCQVLYQYKQGLIESDLLHEWGFLVRKGYFEPYFSKDFRPWVNVVYESEYDLEHDTELWNQMNEITYRLYEIGDIVDGEIRQEELEAWLNNFCKDEICKT